MAPKAYQFVMDKWLPTTIPMKRLAQYMDKLALLFGSVEGVHFDKITAGSAKPLVHVDDVVAFEVSNRVKAANDDKASDAAKICKDINRMLQADGCVGYLRVHHGARLIDFPGRKTPISDEVTVHDTGDLEGTVIRVGGKDNTVPVTIQGADGFYKCQTTKPIAKLLAKHLFEGQVRVVGKGKWLRDSEGIWSLQEFQILDFAPIENSSLTQFVNEMREIPGSDWNKMENPQAELKRIQGD